MLDLTSKRKGSEKNQKPVWGTGICIWTECPQITYQEKMEKKQKDTMRLGGADEARTEV